MATLIDPAVKSQLKQKIANAPDRHIRLAAFKAYGDYVASVQAYDPLPDPSPDPFPVYDPEGHAETWLDAMRLQEQGVEPTRFSSITCPATMIHGADDPHPANLIFADLKPHIPQLQLIELDKCGHEPWLERHTREEFLRLVQHLCQS
jgi:pimeloyl-ACP methyl ester carboxylesterase